jgi:hypothetical protein
MRFEVEGVITMAVSLPAWLPATEITFLSRGMRPASAAIITISGHTLTPWLKSLRTCAITVVTGGTMCGSLPSK